MAFLLPLTEIAPIRGAEPPPNHRSSRAERRGEAARVCVCGRVKGEEKGRVIRVPDPIREPLGLAPLFSGPLLRESSSSSPLSPPSLRDQQREAGDDKQDYYVNMGYAIRTLREEFPDIFYKEPNFDIYRYDAVIEAKRGNPPIMPAVMTPGGPLDLSSVLFRNRIIFIGQPVNSQVAQRVISQLLTLAAVDEDADFLMYLNCPGGSTYSILAIYDCMSWIKPKVGTVCFGVAASQGALLLAGGEKGMRYAMPNARIMIHQPQTGCGGHVEDVRRQVNEAVQSRHKIDKMFAAFTGQPLEKVQQYTERDRFLSASEALEFGLIDGLLETEY